MLFYFALTSAITATVVASKSAYVSRLMKDARPTANSVFGRFLEGGIEIEQIETENALSVDLSEYSLRFEQCRYVESDAFAVTQRSIPSRYNRFAIFRFCPSDSCDSCESNFGEYVIDLKEYLQETVAYQRKLQEEMCETCDYVCEGNDDLIEENADDSNAWFRDEDFFPNASVECNDCYNECEKIKYMTENGYIDATEFIGCQMVYDPEDDGHSGLYAGPMCASNGSKIKIGLFTDDECNVPDSDKDVDDYLMDGDGSSMKLSHALLKTVYSRECISCLKPDEEENANDDAVAYDDAYAAQYNEVEVLEMCEQLYDAAAKCELTNGFDSGYVSYADGYANQILQEEVVCDFVESLKAGSYDESGEIVVNGANSSIGGGSETTGGQKFALTFFILGTFGLAGYAAMLHSKLTKGAIIGLAEQGGSLA